MKRKSIAKSIAVCLASALLIGSVPDIGMTSVLAAGNEQKNDISETGGVEGEDKSPSSPDSSVEPSSSPDSSAEPSSSPDSSAEPSSSPEGSTSPSPSPSADVSSGGAVVAAPTSEQPTTPASVTVRGGSKRLRITWSKVTGADGYYIYCRPSTSSVYTKVKTINDGATVTYDKTSLEQNTTYFVSVSSYKLINGVAVESGLSTAVSAVTTAATKTSKTAKKYSTKAKFTASPAYKKYTAMKNALNYSKTFAIPGMKNTNVGGFNCTSMVPQGITLAGSYFLITAYDSKGTDYSVIYVVSRSSKSYITTIILPSKAKVGGIAFDGTNVWISKGSYAASFPYSFITDTVNAGVSYKKLSAYNTSVKMNTTASYMGYYNGILWVGGYSTSSSTMYGYKVGNVLTTPTLTQTYTMSVPSKTQGITFDSDGTLVLTRGCGKNTTDSGYISQIRTYKPSYDNAGTTGKVLKNAALKTTKMPPKVEGVAIYGTYTYTLFSSSHYTSCKYPVDRVLALKTNKLV